MILAKYCLFFCKLVRKNTMTDNSVSLHRVFSTSPEKVYRAFLDPNAIASWLPPYGFLCVVHNMEPKIGGSFKMSFINFSTGNRHSFGGSYIELKPNEFIKYTDTFDDPNLPGEMTTSVWLKKVSCGTEIKIVQENIPSVIPAAMCYLGWQESLEKLKKLVEPEIPDA
ncbi:SRPBCC family protein [Flavobacterium sp. SM15]|uniref:SRPBCC family protein n=1 Tax=Flavobacterium sp. SM15 TaxID=2908005 RepID=UPI001EDC1D7D|nr:SRPBCC family protein [Flavobacterium sp. SM15]MCG2611981.1 SRPBCC family protein [Flavobacterium sp. SM15]